MKKSLILLVVLLIIAGLAGAAAAQAARTPLPTQEHTLSATTVTVTLPLVLNTIESDGLEYGVDFISAANAPADENRYQQAISTNAGWNRWPLYWYNVETSPGEFNWNYVDEWVGDRLVTNLADDVVAADLAHGLQTELILMGTPGFYASGGMAAAAGPPPQVGRRPAGWQEGRNAPVSPASTTPLGLYEPVFDDGTDVPGSGKGINPANKWARFVYSATARYVPMGITHFEIWNEQDYTFFWNGTVADYARLLKVAYLAADPDAQIIFGGLANFQQPNFLADVLAVLAADSMAPDYDWFFDILATHSYSYAWESWYHVWRADRTLANHGLEKEIWLNESGSPAWDDYPGPTWDPNSGYRSTMQEGAAYVIQSAMYAKYAGADVVFHFQLYDDCGNCPAGSDFPPNDGGICDPENICGTCAGDAFGLFSNPTDGSCYKQHPQPDTPRPVLNAYQVLTDHLQGLEPLWRQRPGGSDPYNGPQEWIAFYRPATGERVLGLWARFGDPETAVVTATGASALLIDHTGTITPLTPVGDTYTLQLGPATNRNLDHDRSIYAIGGPPLILVESDTRPPQVAISLPSPIAPPVFQVTWSGEDPGSGLVDYDIWLYEEGITMTRWLTNTTETSASFVGEPGSIYGFSATGRDRAGNQGAPPAEPQAVTRINTTPVAVDDGYNTAEDTPLVVNPPGVLGNDSDGDEDPLTAVLDSGSTDGTLALSLDGSFIYTPTADFYGVTAFTYHATDGVADSNIATVTITVTAVNDEPVAVDDVFTTGKNTTLTLNAPGVLGNDLDVDNDPLTVALDSGPAEGILVLNPDGSFVYTPTLDFVGAVSFTYHVNDGVVDSNPAVVTVAMVIPRAYLPVVIKDNS